MLRLGIPSVLFVIIGGYLSKLLQVHFLEIILSIFLVGFSLLFLIKSEIVFKPSARNAIVGGSLSGFSAGLLGTGGAIRGLTMAAFNLEKSAFIATSALIDFAIDFSRTIVYYNNGYIHTEELKYVPFLFVIGLLGTWIGKKILVYIPQKNFRKLSLSFILLIGVVTVVQLFITD